MTSGMHWLDIAEVVLLLLIFIGLVVIYDKLNRVSYLFLHERNMIMSNIGKSVDKIQEIRDRVRDLERS